MATLKDVAAKAGVSPSTAGAAMRGESIVKDSTRRKVLDAARELGYSANLSARFLKKGRTETIAVLVPDIRHPYYANIAHAICTAAARQGLRTVIEQTGYTANAESDVLSQINTTVCDGLILNVSNIDDRHLRTLLGNHPTVLLNYTAEDPLFDTVRNPTGSALGTAFGYLRGRGYRHVCVVGGADHSDASGQDDGVRQAISMLQSSGLGDKRDHMSCDWNVNGGLAAARALCAVCDAGGDAVGAIAGDNIGSTVSSTAGDAVDADVDTSHNGGVSGCTSGRVCGSTDDFVSNADDRRPIDRYDALYCMNDLIAYGMLRGLCDAGVHVPDDVAVFGHDGLLMQEPFAPFTTPTLTTVTVDYDDLADKAVSLLVDQMTHPNGKREARVETAACHLVIGESA